MRSIFLSVVIPAYNEARRLPPVLTRTIDYLKANIAGGFEIIVVNDGSTDEMNQSLSPFLGSIEVVQHLKNQGKGAALKTGFIRARGKYVMVMDADGASPIEELSKLLKSAKEGAHVVIGSRACEGGEVQICKPQGLAMVQKGAKGKAVKWNSSAIRYVLGRLFGLFVKCVTRIQLSDTQCGYKLINNEMGRRLFYQLTIPGFAIDVELLYLAKRAGLTIEEIPIEWSEIAGSKVHVVRDGMRMIRDTLRILMRHRQTRSTRKENGIKCIVCDGMEFRRYHRTLRAGLVQCGDCKMVFRKNIPPANQFAQSHFTGPSVTLTTTDVFSLPARVFAKSRENFYFFSERTLRLLLERNGYEIIEMKYSGKFLPFSRKLTVTAQKREVLGRVAKVQVPARLVVKKK